MLLAKMCICCIDNLKVKLLVKILKPNACYKSHGSGTSKIHDGVNDIPTIHCFFQCLSSLQLQAVQSCYHFASDCPLIGYHVLWIHMWHELQKIRDGTITEIVCCSKNTHKVTIIRWSKWLKFVTWSNHKSNQLKSNPNQITCFQIKSFVLKSNQHMWFNHDLNQIMIWICPSLMSCMVTCKIKLFQNYFSLHRRPSEIILPNVAEIILAAAKILKYFRILFHM